MIERFSAWATEILAGLVPGTEGRIVAGAESPNRAMRLELDTPTAIAAIVCWEDGHFSAEALDIETEKYLYQRSGRFEPGEPFEIQLEEFMRASMSRPRA